MKAGTENRYRTRWCPGWQMTSTSAAFASRTSLTRRAPVQTQILHQGFGSQAALTIVLIAAAVPALAQGAGHSRASSVVLPQRVRTEVLAPARGGCRA